MMKQDYSNQGVSQSDIAALFRGNELRNRDMRRSRLKQELTSLTKRMTNEGMLLEEFLTEEDKQAHAAATAKMRAQKLAFERESTPGYWRRLWRALWNK